MSGRATERRALHCLLRYREPGRTPYRRITPVMRADLLGWAAMLSDEELLDMRGIGRTLLRWIREHQIAIASGVSPGRALLARHIDCPGICDVWVERDAILVIEDDLTRLQRIEKAAREAVRAGWFTTNEAGDRAADALRDLLGGDL